MSSTSATSILLSIFYLLIIIFAISDLKRFIFHVHISRVDRAPVSIDIDPLSTLWYPIIIGIVWNILIFVFSLLNFVIIFFQKTHLNRLLFSTLILILLFTIRFLINIILTKIYNGHSTQTLVEKSLFSSSLSLEEELTTIVLDWIFKISFFSWTLIYYYNKREEQTMSIERRRETKLMSNFD